ncbi:MAG: hypothetical protein ICV75_01805 [Nitrospiraceae bacterium]|nr:hypothetical protein [Nitrospiraceae bacterium]
MGITMSNWIAYAGAVLTGLVPPLVMYLIGAQKKVLGYAILKNEPLINLQHPDIDGRVAVSIDGKPVNRCRIMEVEILNMGMKDIESQPVHVTFPAGSTILHSHCWSRTLALGPKIEALEHDSYAVSIPLMNPGDKLVIRFLLANNDDGRVLIGAKGPGLRFKRFDPRTFVSPVVNRSLLVMSTGVFVWIVWACIGNDRFMSRPVWDKTITVILVAAFLAVPSAILMYQGAIPLLKKALRWKRAHAQTTEQPSFHSEHASP